MDARIRNEKKFTIEATSINLDDPNANIKVGIQSNCEHIGDELRMLETATCAFFLKSFPRIHKDNRQSVIDQYIGRVSALLRGSLDQIEKKSE